MKVLIV